MKKSLADCGTSPGTDDVGVLGNGDGGNDVVSGVAGRGRRRRKTQKSLSNDQTCSFTFSVFLDKCGFLLKKVVLTSSNATRHCHHRKCLPEHIPCTKRKQPSRSMDEDPIQVLDSSVDDNNQEPEVIGTEPSTANLPTGNEGLQPSEFMQQMKKEIQILEGLVHSRNFCPSYLNLQSLLDELKRTNSAIRTKMAASSNHHLGLVTNAAIATSNKRQKGSQA